jgi:hypothetical protein
VLFLWPVVFALYKRSAKWSMAILSVAVVGVAVAVHRPGVEELGLAGCTSDGGKFDLKSCIKQLASNFNFNFKFDMSADAPVLRDVIKVGACLEGNGGVGEATSDGVSRIDPFHEVVVLAPLA